MHSTRHDKVQSKIGSLIQRAIKATSLFRRRIPLPVKRAYWSVKYWINRFLRARCGLVQVENLYWDLRYGGLAGGLMQPSRYAHLGRHGVRNVSYRALDKLFRHVVIRNGDVLVDVGCGKGRVVNFWLRQGLPNKLVGLEIDEQVAARVRKRLKRFSNVQIITGDAVENMPGDASILFMYNPFNEAIMKRLCIRLAAFRGTETRVVILYYAPRHVSVFENDPMWKVRRLKMGIYEPACLITLKERESFSGAICETGQSGDCETGPKDS